MIMDERLEFADSGGSGVFNTQSTGIKNVGDHIDLGHANRNPGKGYPLYLVVVVETANDGGSGATGTIQFRLVSDSVSPPAVDGSATVHFMSDTYAATELAAGTIYAWPLPGGLPNYERYLGLQINFGTEEEDDLVASAFLSVDPVGYFAYPDAANTNP